MIIIECTPAIVNKTAIYRIVREAVQFFGRQGKSVCLHSLGKNYSGWDEVVAENKIPRLMFWLLRFPKVVLPLTDLLNWLWPIGFKGPVVFFDPLYILFYSLKKEDSVFVLDLSPLTLPQFHPPNTGWLYQQAFKKLQSSGCKIISISQSTTDDLRVNLGVRASRIEQIRLFANPKLSALSTEPINGSVEPKRFLLFVGSLETRKNILGLLNGFDISGLSDKGIHLVIVGRMGFGGSDVLHLFKCISNVHWVGAVPDEELSWYFENALAFVYPSFWEGFGVPLLEALSYNLPCLATSTGASPEVGGTSVIYCDPCDNRSIADGMVSIVNTSQDNEAKERLIANRNALLNNYSVSSFYDDLQRILLRAKVTNDQKTI